MKLAKIAALAALVASGASAQTNLGAQKPQASLPFVMTRVATFNLPWRLAFLPDGRMLITEKVGPIWLVTQTGEKTPVTNVPAVLVLKPFVTAVGDPQRAWLTVAMASTLFLSVSDAASADGLNVQTTFGLKRSGNAGSMPPAVVSAVFATPKDGVGSAEGKDANERIIFHVTEGAGESTIGDQRFAWQRGDTFVAPGWHVISHRATSDAQVFEMSDEPLLRFSNYYRFEALD